MPSIFLPNEILLNIISHCGPDALKDIALANKNLHQLSTDRIAKYKRYRHVELDFGESKDGPIKPSPWEDLLAIAFLIEVIKDPDAGELVESLAALPLDGWNEMDDWGKLDGDIDGDGVPLFQIAKDVVERENGFEDVFRASPYFTDRAGECARALCDGSEGMAIALLLTLLPNLKEFVVTGNSWNLGTVEEAVRRIAKHNIMNGTSKDVTSYLGRPSALTKLEKFTLLHNDTEGGESPDLFRSFALLPSTRYLYGHMIDGERGFEQISEDRGSMDPSNGTIWPDLDAHVLCYSEAWPFPAATSNVESLRIEYSAIRASKLARFLTAFKNLKELRYDDGGGVVGYEECNVFRLLRSMPANIRETLEVFKFRGDYYDHNRGLDDESDEEDEEDDEEEEEEEDDGEQNIGKQSERDQDIAELLKGFKRLKAVDITFNDEKFCQGEDVPNVSI